MKLIFGIALLVSSLVSPPADAAEPPPAAPVQDQNEAQPKAKAIAVAESPIVVTTRLSPEPSHIGDRLTFEVTAAYPGGYSVNLPTGLDFSPLELLEVDEGEPIPTGDGFRKTFTLSLQYFDVKERSVPSFSLTYVDPKGEVQTVKVKAHPFRVESLLANENEPKRKGEDPLVSLEYPNERAEIIIYSTLLALFLGALGTLLFLRLRRRGRVEVGPPPRPAHELAFEALDALEVRRAELVAQGEIPEYYVELTEIIKGYLHGRFGLDALERTTDELRMDLQRYGTRIQPLKAGDVLRTLEDFDLVKFARFTPAEEEIRRALEDVRGMVEESLPAAQPVDEAKGSGGADSEAESSAMKGEGA